MLTPKRRRALEIIRDHGPIGPGRFAEYMWPDSPCWQKVYKCGNAGSSRGTMMAMAAGGFLGKIWDDGLIIAVGSGPPRNYKLSLKGEQALKAKEV